MSGGGAQTLIVGGSSRIAVALAPLLGGAACHVVRRPAGRPREIIVADYGDIPAQAFDGVRCVVNCVGASTGPASLLERVNVAIPCRLGATAKAAGVRHLIHVSSLSVYGGARAIDRNTRPAPANAYGRSKLAADTALLAMPSEGFAVTILRLPLIYGDGSLGKLGRLLRLWSRLRWLPVPAGDVARAMIGAELAAEVLARLAVEPRTGIVFAADPSAFTYAEAARARPEALRRLPVPRRAADLAARVAPAIGRRLFADSRLAADDNLALRYGLASRLYGDIAVADLR